AFSAHGIGCAVLFGDTVVSGASSYSYYSGGIEIEIDTRADFRRRGLALACGARLILECLDRGLYPSWDAQNLGSLSLAKKLGYEFSHEYPAYEIFDY
ncbi:MAG: GNAT family N-acetyltransferase, partial [Clostridiales bacterium]|nr:GNAT family N-acetyltransferase [Clostridiales bacterium]